MCGGRLAFDLPPKPTSKMSIDAVCMIEVVYFLIIGYRPCKSRLGRRKPRHGHPIGRTRHVIQANSFAEANRVRVAAVLAADADLELRPRRSAALDGDLH